MALRRKRRPVLTQWHDPTSSKDRERLRAALTEHPGLFDVAWYLRQVPVGACDAETALDHFLTKGRDANLSPGPWLDATWYWQEHADVAAVGLCAFDHFALYGEGEGRRPHPDLVLQMPPDVPGGTDLLQLTAEAWDEARQDPDFRAYASLAERCTQALKNNPILFDATWYLERAGVSGDGPEQALQHFLTKGRAANLSPGPWLDPHWYWERYPDVAATGQCAFDHYLLHGEHEGRLPLPDFMPRLALAIVPSKPLDLRTTAAAWAERSHDPEITESKWLLHELGIGWEAEPQLASITPPDLLYQVRGTHSTYLQPYVDRVLDGFTADSFLILVPHFMLGGADRVGANVAAVAAEVLGPERVFVVSTDRGDTASMKWFPAGVTLRVMQTTRESRLDDDDLGRLVADLLMAGRPGSVLNINSRAAWLAYSRHGSQLSQHMRLMATQFCRDFHDFGGFGGYGDEFLRDCMDSLSLVMLDNARFRDDLIDSLGLLEQDADKMQVVYQPSAIHPAEFDMSSRKTQNVLWLGRIADQKRPDLLAGVARLMPDTRFHVFGGPVNDTTVRKYGLDLPNLILHGPVANIESLDPLEYGALLFTSQYEGLPNVPIEVGAWGLPIVASDAGGLGELIDEHTGWLLPVDADASAYAGALRQAMASHEGTSRGLALRRLVAERHTWDRLKGRLREIGMFDPVTTGGA